MSMSRTAYGLSRLGEDWRTQAACRSNPERQFPADSDVGGVAAAKYVCQACPVRRECLRWALDNGEQHGVWGGFTGKERRQYLEGKPRKTCSVCGALFFPRLPTTQHRCSTCAKAVA